MYRMLMAAMFAAAPFVVLAQEATTQMAPSVKADAVPKQQDVAALQQQVAQLQAEIQRIRGQQTVPPVPPAEQVRAQPAPAIVPIPQPPAVQVFARPQPVAVPVVIPAAAPALSPLPPGTRVAVSKVNVTSTTVGDQPGLHILANVTIQGLPKITFIFQGALVTPDGKIHTDARGNPYVATREISTGDDDDTDAYSVELSLKDLFTSGAPSDVGVQVRILDGEGRIVAQSGLNRFRRP